MDIQTSAERMEAEPKQPVEANNVVANRIDRHEQRF
jgi:hypothetical protein